ncbi:MAG: DUF4159 domain-containing protein [Gemmatimonadota bacterium]
MTRPLILAALAVLMAPVARSAAAPAAGMDALAVTDAPTIAQVQYDGGGDWYANPSSLPNLLHEIRLRTGLPVADRPAHVRLTDPDLWRYPYLYITGHGNIRLSDAEIVNLRRYLAHGGFLHVDDNYGLDKSFRREIRRVFPDRELVPLPADNPIYHVFYDLPGGLPKIHKHDGLPAQGFGIFERGRLVVFYSYQSDLGDGWENADVHGDPPEKREAAFRMGVNLFLYAMAQGVT